MATEAAPAPPAKPQASSAASGGRPPRKAGFGPYAITSVVVANMIGTGVFTSLGFQLLEIRSTFPLLLLWAVGGAVALCGAVSYAELGAVIPRSGGEYAFLSRIYHPAAGFVSGCISATVGFAAPTALAAMTFGSYLAAVFPALSPTWLAVLLVMATTAVHVSNHRGSAFFQSSFTTAKVALILAFCAAIPILGDRPEPVSLLPQVGDFGIVSGGAFAVSLVYVSYAYTGWNAATYLAGETRNPARVLPLALASGTSIVVALYLGLNWAFLRAAPMDALAGRVEIGHVAATHVFGEAGGSIMGVALALLLVSTVSAMVMAGPRVLQVMGEDYALLRPLAKQTRSGIPARAVIGLGTLTTALVLTASFETVLVFTGFVLGLNSLVAVAGVYVLRYREPDLPRPYRTWGYPVTPALFLALTGWTLVHIGLARPEEAAVAVGLVALCLLLHGAVVYWSSRPGKKKSISARAFSSESEP